MLACAVNFISFGGYNEKALIRKNQRFRGTKQNRTAVNGFADRCLTTRPWYHLLCVCKGKAYFRIVQIFHRENC